MMPSSSLVMRLHFVFVLARWLGAHRVITAGVQRALQTLEVNGAPASALPDVPVLGEAFRQAFTAKVSGNLSESGSDRAAAGTKKTAPPVSQPQRSAQPSTVSHQLPFLPAQTGARPLKGLPLALAAAARGKINSTEVLASKPIATADTIVATKPTAAGLEERPDLAPEFASVTTVANIEASRQTGVANDASATFPLPINFGNTDFAPALAVRSLPVTAKVTGSGQVAEEAAEEAIVRGSKRDAISSTSDAAASALQIASSSHGQMALAAPEPGPLTNLSAITSSTAVAERLQSADAAGDLLPSVPARTTSVDGSLAAVNVKNSGENKSNSGDAQAVTTTVPSGLNGSTRGDLARENRSGVTRTDVTRGDVVRSSEAIASSGGAGATRLADTSSEMASAGAQKPDRFGGQPGADGRLSDGVSERIGVSNVVPSTGVSTGLARGIRQAGALSAGSISTGSITGIVANPPESTSTVSASKNSAATVPQASTRTGVKAGSELPYLLSGAGPFGKKSAAVDGKGEFSVPAKQTKDESRSADESLSATERPAAGSQESGLAPVPAASELPRPEDVAGVATAASQATVMGVRDRTLKGPADKGLADKGLTDKGLTVKGSAEEDDAAIAAAQPASIKDSLRAVFASDVDQVREAAPSLAPAMSIGAAAVSTHNTPAPLTLATVPIHAAGSAMNALSGTPSDRADGKLETAMAVQVSNISQGNDSHRTLLATPTTLEVGLQSGTQGWLKIRAEAGGQGDVKASLDAVSASGRELLHSQIPALNAFLHSEQMPVTATVAQRNAAPDAGAAGSAMGSGGFSGASHGALLQQGGGQQHSDRQSNVSSSEAIKSGAGEMVKSYDARGGVSDSIEGISARQTGTVGENGRWLNVRV